MKKDKELFIKCECGSEVININKDPDFDEFYISIFRYRHLKPGLKYRLRYCWHILKTGEPYKDETIINKESAKNIVKFLSKYINK